MITLGLHTASAGCEVAIVRNSDCLAEVCASMRKGQDARLPGMVVEALHSAQLQASTIDRIAVVTGPGSFTGVRVGIAFARGLALANGIPCIGVTSLEAALPPGQQGSAIVVLPAQKRPPEITYWTQSFRSGASTGPATEQGLGDLKNLLVAHPHMVFGSGEALCEALPALTVHPAIPTARRAAELGATFDPDDHPAVPVYARAPDALLPGSKRP